MSATARNKDLIKVNFLMILNFSEYMIVNNFNVCYKNRLNSNITQVSDIKKQLHFGVKAIAEINAEPPKL